MSTTTEKDCAVCIKKTGQRCSGCKSVFFCSAKCQAVIWKSHKHFCKDPAPTNFSFPPLSAEEAATFAVGHSHIYCPVILNLVTRTRMYWDEYMAKRGWWEGDPAVRRALFSLPFCHRPLFPLPLLTDAAAFNTPHAASISRSPPRPSKQTLLKELQKKKGCAVPEPARSYILAAMGQYLYFSCAQPHIPEPPNSHWHMTGHDLIVFQQEVESRTGSIPDYTLTRLAPFWHQVLIWHTISLNPKALESSRLLAATRLISLMKDAKPDVPDPVFQSLWQVARAANKESTETSMASLLQHLMGGGMKV